MNIKEAIGTAMQYEQKIRDLYGEEARRTSTPEVKRFFQMLSDDEQRHFDYLNDQLNHWIENEKLEVEPMQSNVPAMGGMDSEVASVKEKLLEEDRGDVKQALSKALKAEIETSDFYRKLTEEFSDEAGKMFAGFLAVEENHIAAVEAELNFLNKSGFFFDVREFDMEGEK